MYWVFVRGNYHLVLHEDHVDTKAINEAGFRLVWDSAPSEIKGARYGAKHYDAVVPVDNKVTR